MKILDHLISMLNFDATLKDVRQGVFHTAVLTQNCGLAATLPHDALRQTPPLVKEPGNLLAKTPRELVNMAYSASILEAAIGMAAINSLLEVDDECCRELNAADLIMEKGAGSVEVSARPAFPKTLSTSGILLISRSWSCSTL